MPDVVFVNFVRNRWPRTDDTRVAAKNIDKLREFVEARPAKPASDRRNARSFGTFP